MGKAGKVVGVRRPPTAHPGSRRAGGRGLLFADEWNSEGGI